MSYDDDDDDDDKRNKKNWEFGSAYAEPATPYQLTERSQNELKST